MAGLLIAPDKFDRRGKTRGRRLRHEDLHKFHGVHTITREHRTLRPHRLAVQISKVGKQVVCHQDRARLKFPKVIENSFNRWCVDKHVLGNSGVPRDELGYAARNSNERVERTDYSPATDALGTYF